MISKSTSKRLIINADDFGWNEDTCRATIECMEAGAISSATIMTGRPATEMACDFAAKNLDRFSFGLHFNIVDQHTPLSTGVDSLLDKQSSMFAQSRTQRLRAMRWGLTTRDLQTELTAQIILLKKMGVRLTHVDSHGHMHKFPNVIKAIKPVLNLQGISRVRRPQNLYGPGATVTTKLVNAMCTPYFRNIRSTQHFLTVTSTAGDWFPSLLQLLSDGITEMAVHPGLSEDWRHREMTPLLNPRFAELLKFHDVVPVSFHDV